MSVAVVAACDPAEGNLEPLLPAWTHELPGGDNKLAFDRQNQLVIAVEGDQTADQSDCVGLMQLARDGSVLWRREYDASDPLASAVDLCPRSARVVVDEADDIVIAYRDVLRKHNAAGDILWAQASIGGGAGLTRETHLAVDAQGNIVVGGTADRPWPYEHVPWVARFDPLGSATWTRAKENVTGSICGVAMDDDGNAWIAEDRISPTLSLEQLDPHGNSLEQVSVGQPHTTCASFARDGQGSLVVLTGGSLHKYLASGEKLWERGLGSEGYRDAEGAPMRPTWQFVAAAPDGTIHVLGPAWVDPCWDLDGDEDCMATGRDVIILRTLDASGVERAARYLDPSSYSVVVRDLAVGSDGTVAFTASISSPHGLVAVVEPVD